MLNIKKLPKNINEINLFKKEEKGSTLYSFAKDNQVTIVCRLEDFEIDRDFCIDKNTLEIIKNLTPIKEFKISDNKIKIVGANGKLSSKLIEENLPQIDMNKTNKVEVDLRALSCAKNFTANDSNSSYTSFAFQSIRLNNYGDIYSTDRYIAYKHLNERFGDIKRENEVVILIPKNFVAFLEKEFDTEEKIEIFYQKNICLVEKENITYISKLFEGNYPNLQSLFEGNCGNETTIDFADFKKKTKIAEKIGANENNKIVFYTFNNGKLIVDGDSTYEADLVETQTRFGDYDFTISAENVKKISSATKNSEITFKFKESKHPIFFLTKENDTILTLPILRDNSKR